MKVTKARAIGCILFISLFLLPSISFAESNQSLTNISTEKLSLNGEEFEIETIKDANGHVYYTISTEVKDKEKVAAYVNELIEKRNSGDNQLAKWDWTRNMSGKDGSGRHTWDVTGYSEVGLLINPDKFRVNNGSLYSVYGGAGNADKLVLNTNYTFNGVTMSFSFPPELKRSSNTISWTSEAVTGTWFVKTSSLWAEATSRTQLTTLNLRGGADIYKGSNIYRPDVSSTARFGSSN